MNEKHSLHNHDGAFKHREFKTNDLSPLDGFSLTGSAGIEADMELLFPGSDLHEAVVKTTVAHRDKLLLGLGRRIEATQAGKPKPTVSF